MIFIDNKYTKWYYAIIDNAAKRINLDDDQLENHHIIPDCFFKNRSRKGTPGWLDGNSEDKNNKIKLTTKEHFVCHHLLTKMVTGKSKYQMLQAATAFTKWVSKNHNRKIKITARTYSYLKKQRSITLKYLWANDDSYRNSALSGLRKLATDKKHKKKMSNLRKLLWKDPEYINLMNKRPRTYKKVIIQGINYNSLLDAGSALGVTANCVSKRCTSPNFPDWNYG